MLQSGLADFAILPITAAPVLLDCTVSPAACVLSDKGLLESQLVFAALPGLPAGQAVGTLGAWAIPLHAAHAQAAQQFGTWLAGPQGARVWALNGGIPAAQGLMSDPQVAASAPYLAVLDGFQSFLLPYAPVRSDDQVEAVLQDGIQEITAGQVDGTEAAQAITEQLRRVLHQAGYETQ